MMVVHIGLSKHNSLLIVTFNTDKNLSVQLFSFSFLQIEFEQQAKYLLKIKRGLIRLQYVGRKCH